MRHLKIWLIEKSKVQTFIIMIVIIITIASRYFIDKHLRTTQDFYSPIIYSLLILWVYYSLFFKVIFNEDANEKIVLKRSFEYPKDSLGKFIKLSLLIFFGYRSYFIFDRPGVVFSLLIITFTGLFCIYLIAKDTWGDGEFLQKFAIMAGFVGYIYFIPWKSTFCREFGVKEIGNYFEKDKYEAKYLIELSSLNGLHTYRLPADIFVSDEFSEYDSYETETGIGAYSNETTVISEIRYAKIKKVYLTNGGALLFNDCLIPIDNSEYSTCNDQNGVIWRIEMTKEKVK